VRSALLDTGALVAIVNRRDRFHSQLTDLLKDYDGRFLTTGRFILIPGGK